MIGKAIVDVLQFVKKAGDTLTGQLKAPFDPIADDDLGRKSYIDNTANVSAEAFANGLKANLTANGGVNGGNLGLTTHICFVASDGKIQIGSNDNGNEVTFYASGSDFADGTVKTRVFLSRGEVYIETGVSAGAVVTSTKGICGASQSSTSGDSPMPLGVEGFSGRQFFLFAFRNSEGTGSNIGKVYVAAGAVASDVQLLNGAGTVVVDSASIDAFGLAVLNTNANSEFQVVATQPVFVGVLSRGDDSNTNYDCRLVPPLTTNLIGQNRNARLSALYNNTKVKWYRQNGQIGEVTVSPGSPVSIYSGTVNELGDVFYIEPNATPATGGTFTITINGETTSNIAYNADQSGVLAGLDSLASYSSADFELETVIGSSMDKADTRIMILAKGLLGRVAGSPAINTGGLTGNAHTLTIYQAGTQANNAGANSDYAKEGCLRLVGTGPISCLSGADGAGLEATYYFPESALTQRIPLYFGTDQSGNGDQSGICVQSPYKGSYKIFRQDGSLAYSYAFDRDSSLSNPHNKFEQRFPCAFNLTGTSGAGADATFTEDFSGGYIEADVPIYLVMNTRDNDLIITNGIETRDDEVVIYGTTPEDCRAEIRCANDGRFRKRVIADDGTESWELV